MVEKDKVKRGNTYEEGVGFLPLDKVNCDNLRKLQASQVIEYSVSKENRSVNMIQKEYSRRPCGKERVVRKEDSSKSGERTQKDDGPKIPIAQLLSRNPNRTLLNPKKVTSSSSFSRYGPAKTLIDNPIINYTSQTFKSNFGVTYTEFKSFKPQ